MAEDGTVSWRQLLAEATEAFGAVEARWIVERASGLEGAELWARLDDPATRRGVGFFDLMVERRRAGEPLQHVLGRWQFRTLDLLCDRRALIPRPETEVVVDVALAEVDRCGARLAVDLGTGTGAIALSLAAERPRLAVVATDISADALAVARANLAGLGRPAARVRLVAGDWYGALDPDLAGTVDVIVSNPPYIADDEELPPEVEHHEPRIALRAGPTGLEQVQRVVEGAPTWLRPGGSLVVEIAPHQAAAAAGAARAAGFGDVAVLEDLAGRPRVLRARHI